MDLEHLLMIMLQRLQSEVGPFIVHEPDNFTFKVLTDYSGYWRCRQILQVNDTERHRTAKKHTEYTELSIDSSM